MIKKIIIGLLTFSSLVARGEGVWEDKVKCIAELVRVNAMLIERPLELSVRLFPLTKKEMPLGYLKGEGVFDFGDGIHVRFEVELQEGQSNWSAKGDVLSARSWLFKKEDGAINLYGFDERTSDEANNYYKLGLVKKQSSRIFVLTYMVNHDISELLLTMGKGEKGLVDLVKQKLVEVRSPYVAHIFCELWRPGLRPNN